MSWHPTMELRFRVEYHLEPIRRDTIIGPGGRNHPKRRLLILQQKWINVGVEGTGTSSRASDPKYEWRDVPTAHPEPKENE